MNLITSIIRTIIIPEFEIERLEEYTSFFAEERKLSVHISNQAVFIPHSLSHDVSVSDWSFIGLIGEDIWLLSHSVPGVVISWERIKCTKHVPSCTKLRGGIIVETANIWSSHWDTDDITCHNSDNRVLQVVLIGKVISKPSRTIFTHAGKSTSFGNESSFGLILKPVMSCFSLHTSVKRVSIKLFNPNFMSGIERKSLCFKITTSWNIRKLMKQRWIWFLVIYTYSIAEVRWFIHIKPDSIKFNLIIDLWQPGAPPRSSIIIEPIREHGINWPNSSS